MTVVKSTYTPVARALIVLGGLCSTILAMASTAPMEVAASGACLALIVLLLWRGEELPILLLPALFQWSEVAIVPISTIWRRVPLNELSRYGADLDTSAFYGLAGVATLSVGMAWASGRSRGIPFAVSVRRETVLWGFREIAVASFAAMVAGYGFATISGFAGPAREFFNQASSLKYVGLFAFVYWCLVHKSHYRFLVAVVAFEVAFGMTGFFAEFKNSLLTLVVAALAARPKLRAGDVAVVVLASGLLLTVAIFWSAVKPDYRPFLNQGTGAQVVLVPLEDRMAFLADAAISMDGETFVEGFDELVSRHGYIDFLALTMEHVPDGVPHENGRLTWAVLQHIAMPRFLFPEKAPLPSDTEVMAHYTGLPYNWNQNTSISIGYLGELYVDFGMVGGLFAAGIVGGLVGFVYRTVRDHRRGSALLRAGLCLMVALPIAYFGTAYVKLVGAFVFSSAIAIATQRYLFPIALPWLLSRLRQRPARGRPPKISLAP